MADHPKREEIDNADSKVFSANEHARQDAFSLAMDDADSVAVASSSSRGELPRPGVVHVSGAAPQGKGRTLAPSSRRLAEAAADQPVLASAQSGTIDRPLRPSLQETSDSVEPSFEFVGKSNVPVSSAKSPASPPRQNLQNMVAPAEPPQEFVQGSTIGDQGEAKSSTGVPSSRRTGGVRPTRRADAKAVLREEMNSLRQTQGGTQTPGAMAVSGVVSSGTATVTARTDGKADLREEANALRKTADSQGPGAVAVSGVVSSGAARTTVRGDGKAALKQEMNALKKNHPGMQSPGAVSVSSAIESDSFHSARADRASRKAKRQSFSMQNNGLSKIDVASGLPRDAKQAPDPHPGPKPGAIKQSGPRQVGKSSGLALVHPVDYNFVLKGGIKEDRSIDDDPGIRKSKEMSSRSSDLAKQVSSEAGFAAKEKMKNLEAEEGIISAQVVDEEELEAEYQAKMMQNVVAATEVLPEDELKKESTSCCRRICCPLIVIAIVLAIVLPLTGKDPEIPPTQSPTIQSEVDYLYELLYPYSGDSLMNDTAAQGQAFNWLASEDPAMLQIKETNDTTLLERYALAVLYYSTRGDQWTSNLRFLSNYSHCEWFIGSSGLRCDEMTREVTHIRLNNNNLNGTLPSELSALTRLEILSSAGGGLYGSFPSEIGSLQSMIVLQIASHAMTGTIPTSFERLSNLVAINLFDNMLSGTIPSSWFANLALGETFIFANNQLTGTIPEFNFRSACKRLFAEGNMLEGSIPQSLYSQPDLQSVTLSDNLLNGTISQTIVALAELASFLVDGNQLSGTIPVNLGKLEDLRALDLSGNEFFGPIPSEIGNLGKLSLLDLSSNRFTGTLPSEVGGLESLESFTFSSNGIVGEVPSSFLELSALSTFSLRNTSIVGGLEETFCGGAITVQIEADCGGDTPKINCSCCSTCCDVDDCEVNVPAVCSLQGGPFELDSERGASCSCSEDGTTLSCSDTCQSCNLDNSVCVESVDYGYTLNETTGVQISFYNELQYVKGRNETMLYTRDFEETNCRLEVDGEQCLSCGPLICASGLEGFMVDCSNLEEGLEFDSCRSADAGYLEMFYLVDPSLLLGCAPQLLHAGPK